MKHLTIIALVTLVCCSSCSQHFYAPALYNNDISYQPKPASFDSAKTATYISIGGGFTIINSDDGISLNEFNVSRAHVFNNTNLSYGAFGVIGSIDKSINPDEKDPYSFVSKNFAAVGG